ncbi:MAG: hypothetical protein FWG10_13480 [Eubacteriaceae bacterium]|nr:hypothetical protein [Eubacteriaceae bacterium]
MELIAQEQVAFRKSLFIDAMEGKKKPARVPLCSNDRTGKIFDAGYKLSDCFYDYDKMDDAVYRYHERYEFDAYFDLGTRNPVKASEALKIKTLVIDDEKGHFNIIDNHFIDEPETGLKAFTEAIRNGDMSKFLYENIVPKSCVNFEDNDDKFDSMANAAFLQWDFLRHGAERQKVFLEKYGVPQLSMYGALSIPVEMLFNNRLRGISGFSTDMRRHPELLEDFSEALFEIYTKRFEAEIANYKENDNIIYAYRTAMLCHTVMSSKQFERFFWKYAKQRWDTIGDNGMKGYIHAEGSQKRIFDSLKDIKYGTASIMVEQDDPRITKEALPNITVCGGFPCALMGHGTVSQCLDRIKQMLDELAYDGRYIYTTDKMISYPNDVKPENQLAVHNFVKEYGVFA